MRPSETERVSLDEVLIARGHFVAALQLSWFLGQSSISGARRCVSDSVRCSRSLTHCHMMPAERDALENHGFVRSETVIHMAEFIC